MKFNLDAVIPMHSRGGIDEPSWILVSKGAAKLLEKTAYALDGSTQPVAVVAYQPGATFKTASAAGSLHSHFYPDGRIGKNIQNTPGGVVLCSPKPGNKSMKIALGNHKENVDALLKAALLCEAGNQVMLWTNGEELVVLQVVGAALRPGTAE